MMNPGIFKRLIIIELLHPPRGQICFHTGTCRDLPVERKSDGEFEKICLPVPVRWDHSNCPRVLLLELKD